MQGVRDKEIAGKKITVIGAARSGAGVAQLLKEKGAAVFVSDSGPAEKLRAQMKVMASMDIDIETGGHSNRVYDAEMMVLSPGVPSTAPVVREARRRELRIISELELASWFCPCPIVAVTGTNGKTTTTTLIGRLLHDGQKRHVVAGNIGTAFSSVVSELDDASVAVLEVSSFQLDDIESFHPKISIILNITPDHLDRYEHSFDRYIASKCRVFENQTKEDVLIYNDDDAVTREHVERLAGSHVRLMPFGLHHAFEEGSYVDRGRLFTRIDGQAQDVIGVEEISIKGIHNLYNSMAAALTAQLMAVSVPSIRATLRNFKGVEHRLEFVREVNRVKFVNDSKATNVDSVWYALQTFKEPIVLLLGGRDKGNEYGKLADLTSKHVKAIVAIGESSEKVYRAFLSLCPVIKAASMEDAVKAASTLASPGDVVLLSPACASFDWFDNYEHRGRVFKEIVNAL